jgi:hypothetical protein
MNIWIVLGIIALLYVSLEIRGEMAIRDSEREQQERNRESRKRTGPCAAIISTFTQALGKTLSRVR